MSVSYLADGQRSRLLADALLHVGYTSDHIRTGWKYSNFDLMKKWIGDDDPDNFPTNEAPATLDIAAFYDGKEHNWNTISFAAQLDRIDLVHDKGRGFRGGPEDIRRDPPLLACSSQATTPLTFG